MAGNDNGAGRPLPHSIDAEEYVISSCLLDGASVLALCNVAGLTASDFYEHKHSILLNCMADLSVRALPIDVAVVAEELKRTKQLEEVGGYAALARLSSLIPTTAQASYFIAKVRELAMLRAVIRSATVAAEDCYRFSGGIDDLMARVESNILGVTRGRAMSGESHEMKWDDLLTFNPDSDPDCMMGKRYLGRTSGLIIVAPSGVGKSVLALQLSAGAALCQPFFGLKMAAPMRVLYVQAEDDHGDVAETVQGFVNGRKLDPTQVDELKRRLRIVRWNDAAGEVFLNRLRQEHRRFPYDLLVINPLFSFCGCNVSEQKELSPFLRNGLNQVLNETRSAAVLVHHTNKPPKKEGKSPKEDLEEELRYIGSGSAELTNWARAYVTLQMVRGAPDGTYKMTFVKRGGRAGIVDACGQLTKAVYIKHSPPGGGMFWLPSDYRPESSPDGQFQMKFDLERARSTYDPRRSWKENHSAIAEDQGVSEKTVGRYKAKIESPFR